MNKKQLSERDIFTYFFFQAEDGIRDATVTGVQTCALPISLLDQAAREEVAQFLLRRDHGHFTPGADGRGENRFATRSEERRVGKEGRTRWPEYLSKKYQSRKAKERQHTSHSSRVCTQRLLQ